MQTRTLDPILEQLRAALKADDVARAAAIIETLRAPDQADLVSELDEATQVALMPQLDPAASADILEETVSKRVTMAPDPPGGSEAQPGSPDLI